MVTARATGPIHPPPRVGGVAGVLQARSTGADVTHLGSLASVGCYIDDAQIEQIAYRRMDGANISYSVRLWPLS